MVSDDSNVTLGEVYRTVERIESKVDRLHDDHETRLRSVERWVYAIPASLITAVLGAAIAILRGS